jgi:hypothetical protein
MSTSDPSSSQAQPQSRAAEESDALIKIELRIAELEALKVKLGTKTSTANGLEKELASNAITRIDELIATLNSRKNDLKEAEERLKKAASLVTPKGDRK